MLKHHSASITSLEFSVDDAWIISGSEDTTACIWNSATGEMQGPPFGHSSGIYSLNISRDGSRLACLNFDDSLTIWDVAARTINLGPLTSPKRRATALSLSHDGTQVAALYTFREFKFGLEFIIRDTANGKVVLEKKIGTEVEALALESFRVCYTADDKYLIIQYGQLEPGIVAKRAFHRSSGEECLEGRISECHSLLAIQTQIIGPFFLQLPMDGNWMARILCWDSTEDKIVIGTYSGDVYFVAFAR
jgi:hypothetical protein